MSTFANSTTVTPEKTWQEIEATLKRYGASSFVFGWDGKKGMAGVAFELRGVPVRLTVRVPDGSDKEELRPFREAAMKNRRGTSLGQLQEQAVRQRWRALALYVKACLEMVENRLVDIEEAFLFAVVTPAGPTVGEVYRAQIREAITAGRMPPPITGLLPAPKGGD